MASVSAGLPDGLEVYIRLVWLFVLVITILMPVLCYLYLAMRRSLRREQTSLAFSNLVIEGLETERRRISRELHDTVLPLVRDPQLSGMIRAICMELAPPDFTRLSLESSIIDVCDKFSKRTGIQCACSIDEGLDFTPLGAENQLHLFRIVQEAFTNIEKHSRARRASLVVRRDNRGSPGSILICVSDDGVGLRDLRNMTVSVDGKGPDAPGLGMRSMQQRAVIIEAQLDFISESGNGLMVRLEVPLSGKITEKTVRFQDG